MLDRQPAKSTGNGPHVFTKTELGFNPSNARRSCQVNAEGLDGGTFDVAIMVPGLKLNKTHEAAKLETDTVVLLADVICEGIVVTLNNLGGNADPVVVVNSKAGG